MARLPPRLSERDAWEIALAWREQLQGCVRLEIGAEGGAFRAVDSFEWVTFMFHGARDDGFEQVAEPVDAARCARAASVAWFALSCCSGFGGTENPRFWRRVFSELHAPKGHQVIFRRPRAQIHITDAVRFFDHADRPFPRVRIEPSVQHKEDCIRAFLGYALDAQPEEEPSPMDTFLAKLGELLSFTNTPRRLSTVELDARLRAHGARLDAMLQKLAPFIRWSHWRRRLPMGISRVDAADLAWILPGLGFERDRHGLHYDQLQLDSVFLRDDETHLETAVRSLLTKTHVAIVLPKAALPRFVSNVSGQISSLLVPQGSNCDGRLKIGTLTAVCPHETTFTALCSALPHSRLIKSVRLDVKSSHISTIIGLRTTEWAWLGYAFFHPDAARDSVFAQLDLDQYRIVESKVEILRRMARGNNLFTIDQDDTAVGALPQSDYYHQGKVSAGTVVYAKPGNGAAQLLTLPSEAWLTLCIESGHFFSLGKWVSIVVPGRGLGWIMRKRILQIESRPPGPSCLRSLRVNVESTFGGLGPLLQLLSIIGERLEYLHIVGRRNPLDASSVASILQRCPSLISLRICHDGSFWSDIEVDQSSKEMPQLRELELVVGSYQHLPVLSPLRSPSLHDLKVLRVVTLAKTSFAANRGTFVDVLARYPQLSYANWSLGWSHTGCSPLRSYDEHQTASMARFGDLQEAVDVFVDQPMHVSCRLAFLSVIYHELTVMNEAISSLSYFGRDVVAAIFAFATTRTPRDVYVDDEVEFVTGHVRN